MTMEIIIRQTSSADSPKLMRAMAIELRHRLHVYTAPRIQVEFGARTESY